MLKSVTKKLKVLIADDDRFVRRIAKIILQDAGFEEIVEATSGAEATNLFNEHRFDLALLDINMHPIDGLILTQYMRATPSLGFCNIPIVIMTTECHRDVLMRAKQVGVDQLCLKPLSPENLLRRVEAALLSRRTITEAGRHKLVLKAAF